MKQAIKTAVFVAALGLGGVAFAAGDAAAGSGSDTPAAGHAGKHAGRGGQVKSVTETSLVLTDKSGNEVTVPIDKDTKITKDGNPATAADLTPGTRVSVTPDTGTATEVQIHTKSKAGKKGGQAKSGGDANSGESK